jgi:hypothetical protein
MPNLEPILDMSLMMVRTGAALEASAAGVSRQ